MRWALMGGNFAIGCGVLAAAGALNDLVEDLRISVALGGQLVTIGAVVMAGAAPPLAAWLAGHDRRRLITFWLLWFGIGHLLQALMPSFAPLAVLRGLTLLGAAVYTPLAAATIGSLAPDASRGRAIAFVFMGWALASVLGMPGHAYIAGTLGWRAGFAATGVLALASAWQVWHTLPAQVHAAPLPAASMRRVLGSPVLMAMIGVTAMAGAAFFSLFAYMAPYYKFALQATPAQQSLLFMVFGTLALAGNVLVAHYVDRWGPANAATLALAAVALSMLLWPLGQDVGSMMLVYLPWALCGFAAMSAQQARLSQASPTLAPILMALNSASFYVGQAVGSICGGIIVASAGFGALHWAGLTWALLAMALSLWVQRAAPGGQVHG